MKLVSFIMFFGSLFVSCFVDQEYSEEMVQVIISFMLLVIFVEVLKIVRAVIVLLLSFLKDSAK